MLQLKSNQMVAESPLAQLRLGSWLSVSAWLGLVWLWFWFLVLVREARTEDHSEGDDDGRRAHAGSAPHDRTTRLTVWHWARSTVRTRTKSSTRSSSTSAARSQLISQPAEPKGITIARVPDCRAAAEPSEPPSFGSASSRLSNVLGVWVCKGQWRMLDFVGFPKGGFYYLKIWKNIYLFFIQVT